MRRAALLVLAGSLMALAGCETHVHQRSPGHGYRTTRVYQAPPQSTWHEDRVERPHTHVGFGSHDRGRRPAHVDSRPRGSTRTDGSSFNVRVRVDD